MDEFTLAEKTYLNTLIGSRNSRGAFGLIGWGISLNFVAMAASLGYSNLLIWALIVSAIICGITLYDLKTGSKFIKEAHEDILQSDKGGK